MLRVVDAAPGVALLRMDDGKVNAIGPAFLDAFPKAWAEASAGGRAIVLAGNAKAFCAGLDLKALPGLGRDGAVAFARGFMRMFADVADHPRPVVAAVDGAALAGGAVLALCADLRLVGPRARLGLTEVPIGIPFPRAVVELARDRLPPHEHAPALLHGVQRAGDECVRAGWAHEHHESERLEGAAVAWAAALAAHHPPAFASAKRPLNAPLAEALRAFAERDADAWTDALLAPETLQAIAAGFARAKGK